MAELIVFPPNKIPWWYHDSSDGPQALSIQSIVRPETAPCVDCGWAIVCDGGLRLRCPYCSELVTLQRHFSVLGQAVVDPTQNVLDLVRAVIQRRNDLREAQWTMANRLESLNPPPPIPVDTPMAAMSAPKDGTPPTDFEG